MELSEFVVLQRLFKDVVHAFLLAESDKLVVGDVRRTEDKQRLLYFLPRSAILICEIVQCLDLLNYFQSIFPGHLKI